MIAYIADKYFNCRAKVVLTDFYYEKRFKTSKGEFFIGSNRTHIEFERKKFIQNKLREGL
jgi:hypothetical protein